MTPDQEPRGSRDNLEPEIRKHTKSSHSPDILTTEDLVASLATEHHLHTHGFDLPAQEIHRSTCTDGRNVICLEVVDYIRDGVEAFLDGEDVLVVERA